MLPEITDYLFNLEQELKKQLDAKIKWVAKKNLHLTLKFLGEISEKQLEQVKKHLSAVKFRSFELSLNKIDFFPKQQSSFSKQKPRILWINLHPPEKIIKLQQLIDQETLFIPSKTQQFKAHLTLGRIKLIKKQETLKTIQSLQLEKKPFTISEFQFLKSTLTKDGPQYFIIQKYTLT